MEEDRRKENRRMDNDVRISHRNILWYVYRMLAEDVIITDETEKLIIGRDNRING